MRGSGRETYTSDSEYDGGEQLGKLLTLKILGIFVSDWRMQLETLSYNLAFKQVLRLLKQLISHWS